MFHGTKDKIIPMTESLKLKEEHPPFRKYGTDFYVGCMNAVVDIDQVSEILKNHFNYSIERY